MRTLNMNVMKFHDLADQAQTKGVLERDIIMEICGRERHAAKL
jgi:hypothetical protein